MVGRKVRRIIASIAWIFIELLDIGISRFELLIELQQVSLARGISGRKCYGQPAEQIIAMIDPSIGHQAVDSNKMCNYDTTGT